MPYADVAHIKVPDGMTDEQALFLSNLVRTGHMAAGNCSPQSGKTVAMSGRGPDACIDAAGTEADPASSIDAALDKAAVSIGELGAPNQGGFTNIPPRCRARCTTFGRYSAAKFRNLIKPRLVANHLATF